MIMSAYDIMTDFLRTFIAVKIDPQPDLIRIISDLKESLKGQGIKWVDLNNLHLTLKFIGDTPALQVSRIKALLTQICAGFGTFSFDLEGIGYFKSRGIPKVLYAKIRDNGILINYAGEIDKGLTAIGFEREKRQFHPHLTIARIKYLGDRATFYRLSDRYNSLHLQTVTIRDIIFYNSILKSSGPVYKELSVIKLK